MVLRQPLCGERGFNVSDDQNCNLFNFIAVKFTLIFQKRETAVITKGGNSFDCLMV